MSSCLYGKISEYRVNRVLCSFWWNECSEKRITENNTPDTNVGNKENEVEDEETSIFQTEEKGKVE